jgi:hypothetical protein
MGNESKLLDMSYVIKTNLYYEVRIKKYRLTKKRAMILLIHNALTQRKPDFKRIWFLVHDMNEGGWRPNMAVSEMKKPYDEGMFEGIEISAEREIIEGQHRLMAFCMSDLEEIEMYIAFYHYLPMIKKANRKKKQHENLLSGKVHEQRASVAGNYS